METIKLNNHIGLIFLGLFLGLGVVISTQITMQGLKEIKSDNQVIAVKGYAEKVIVSDTAIWNVTYRVRDENLKEAHKKIKDHDHKIKDFLISKGIPDNKIVLKSSQQMPLFKKVQGQFGVFDSNQTEVYEISRSVEVKLDDVDLISSVSVAITELTSEGIEISYSTVGYFYSKLDEVKTELLALATQNAYDRAKTLAKNSNSNVGELREAKQGVFQFTPEFSTDTSDYGMLDSSSIKKMARAVIAMSFSIKK